MLLSVEELETISVEVVVDVLMSALGESGTVNDSVVFAVLSVVGIFVNTLVTSVLSD